MADDIERVESCGSVLNYCLHGTLYNAILHCVLRALYCNVWGANKIIIIIIIIIAIKISNATFF